MICCSRHWLIAALGLALPALLVHVSLGEEPKPAPTPRKSVQLPGIVIELEKGYVDVEGQIRVNDGYLELVACTKDTKEHESIVAVAARPMHIHTALLLLGAKNGHPAVRKPVDKEMLRWVLLPPRGDPIGVFLVLEDKQGKPVERPIRDFILYSKQRIDEVDGEVLVAPEEETGSEAKEVKKFPETFLFVGSHLMEEGEGARRYLADSSGNVISIATFGDEVLSLPFRQTQQNDALSWRANPKTLPKVGTPVKLRLRLAKKPDSSPTAKPPVQQSSPQE